jgi:hypothetical protein
VKTRRVKKNVSIPDAGTWLGLFHAPVQLYRKHGAPARCLSHLPPHFFAQVLGETSPLRSTSLAEAVRRGCHAQDPHRKGKFPNHRSQYSLFVAIRSIPDELCGGSRVSGVACKVNNKHHRSMVIKNTMWRENAFTPTSRKRTSRHSAPKSFIRFRANSRRFPEFSDPEVTSGRGMSL